MHLLGGILLGTIIATAILTAVPWWLGLILVILDIVKGPGIDSIIIIISYIMAIKFKISD
ncbi:MAG: hypothetical protein IJ794_00275 [Lachnospiraceae bacterium]|nr:hypothetical protein [Lachnospiraceae bacterium]